ncbi:T6SS immunity protein Tdi1 domain-containing protein [Achromobacter marplatensis]
MSTVKLNATETWRFFWEGVTRQSSPGHLLYACAKFSACFEVDLDDKRTTFPLWRAVPPQDLGRRHMTFDDLIARAQHLDSGTLLEDWSWLLGENHSPVLITAIGNVFVQNMNSGEIQLLDVGSADLVPVAGSSAEFQELIQQQDFVVQFFDAGLVGALRASGLNLSDGQLFGFKLLPSLGGEYTVENFEPTDIEVHFSLTGQLQAKISKLEPGTQIGAATITGQ